jgi:DNA-binding MarR family transcriptional regulator
VHRSDNEYNRQILQAIASGGQVTQRTLATEMGVALGLTNLLIRRLIAKGYVRMARLGARQVRYLMTSDGWEALGRATRLSLENTVHLYTQTREQIRVTLKVVSERCEADSSGQKRVVFYGAGDVAEIAYVSLQSTDLTLVGVVDDKKRGHFFGLPICASDDLSGETLGSVPFALVVVTSVRHADTILSKLDTRAVPRHRICCPCQPPFGLEQ